MCLRSEDQYPKIRIIDQVALLLGEQAGVILVVAFLAVDDDVLRRRDQAMLDAAVAAQQTPGRPRCGKTRCTAVRRPASAERSRWSATPRCNSPRCRRSGRRGNTRWDIAVPVIDGEQNNVPLVDPPDVGQRGHEGAVDHIPALAVVLLLLVDDRERGSRRSRRR